MKSRLLLSCLLAAAAQPASAGNVTLYGLLSQGVMYTNNAAGGSKLQTASGVQQGPRFGMKGSEDLGDGDRAIFNLEGGFSLNSGSMSQGGRLFGRAAFVGLANDRLGQLTFGRQADTMAQSLAAYEAAVQFATYGVPIGDNDNVFTTFRENNAVQYKSPTLAGFQWLAGYAFANKTAGSSDNNDFNTALTYADGPFSAGIAYHVVNKPNSKSNADGAVSGDYGYTSPFVKSQAGAAVDQQEMYGAGGSYTFGATKLSLMYTHSQFDYLDHSRLGLSNYEVTVTNYITPSVLIGLGYIYTDGRYRRTGERPRWHQLDAGIDWFLSKRTDVFLVGIAQKAAGDARFAQIYNNLPSSSGQQLSVSVGVRHKF